MSKRWNLDNDGEYILVMHSPGGHYFMLRKRKFFVLMLMLFSTIGNGLLTFCIGADDHRVLEIRGDVCSTKPTHDPVDIDGKPNFNLQLDYIIVEFSDEGDCRDIEFELSDYRSTEDHSFCDCCILQQEILFSSLNLDSDIENEIAKLAVSFFTPEIPLSNPVASQTLLLI